MHDSGVADVQRLIAAICEDLQGIWAVTARSTLLNPSAPRFEF
jgi:hypothetical protein